MKKKGVEEVVVVYCDSNAAYVHSKRMLKMFVWRLRAEIIKKKKIKNTFCYDPLSYALNFDDGNFGFFCS